jgi:multidrug efflux pump subunit AcrA (membrane-fusion protein)
MKKSLRNSIFAISAIAFTFGAAGCKGKNAKSEETEKEQVYAVNTYKTVAGNLDDYLEFGGDVSSVNAVAVLPDMAGKVSRVLVSVGDLVHKDQVVAYVDASRAGYSYTASPVKAPISGRITALPATVGATVSQSSPIATVAQTDDLEVKINIAERFISRIEQNQTAIITFDAYPSAEFKATAFEISPVLDTSSRTMQVKLRFNEKDDRIKVGMYARVKLVTESVKDAILVPATAVVTRDQKPFIFVVAQKGGDASVKLTPVKLGLTVDNQTEITEGLTVGDEIVVKGMALLNDGAKINIMN